MIYIKKRVYKYTHNNQGFSLISCMVYIFLSMCIAILVLSTVVRTQYQLTHLRTTAENITDFSLALDVLVRDIRDLSLYKNIEYIVKPSEIIIMTPQKSISWLSRENKKTYQDNKQDNNVTNTYELVRKEGIYSPHTNRWGNKKVSIVSHNAQLMVNSCNVHQNKNKNQKNNSQNTGLIFTLSSSENLSTKDLLKIERYIQL